PPTTLLTWARRKEVSRMRVSEVMRAVPALGEAATLADVVDAIETSGCEAVPIVSSNGSSEWIEGQLVSVRDLPKLRKGEASGRGGHAVGGAVLDLLGALGREPKRFTVIDPGATLTDAWGMMAEESTAHLPVIDDGEIVGMVSLFVTFSEFPQRSPAAGFWP